MRRRLGRETFDRLVEPLVGAVYAADMELLSVEATLSRFREMEQQHGSLIRAMRHQMAAGGSPAKAAPATACSSPCAAGSRAWWPRPGSTLAAGQRTFEFAGRSDQRLAMAAGKCGRGPRNLRRGDCGGTLARGQRSCWRRRIRELAARLARIEHSGTAIVSLGYEQSQITHPLDGDGAVVPAIEGSPILACSFSSRKYPHRAGGAALLRVVCGGARRPELAVMPDENCGRWSSTI